MTAAGSVRPTDGAGLPVSNYRRAPRIGLQELRRFTRQRPG